MLWPCVEQNPPGTHFPLIADISWFMRIFALVRFSGGGRPVALSHVLPPVIADSVMLSVFSSAIEAIILLYCVVVVAASDSITTVLPLGAADKAPKWTSNCSMKEAREPAMWLPGGPTVVGGEISWTRAAECAEPKSLLRPVVGLDYLSSTLWRGGE